MSEDPDLHVVEFPDHSDGEGFRQKLERSRIESRRRYHDHLAAVFIARDCPDPHALADAALDALTVWRRLGSDEQCSCCCHPQLPGSDFHDFGFGCPCTRTPEERRRAFEEFRLSQREFWSSPEGRRITEAEEAEEDALVDWLATQTGVAVTQRGGMCPEQWSGEVDGHSFYFRERHGDWRIELDLRPSGWFVNAVSGLGEDGKLRTIPREIDEGEIIATGTIDADGYGTTPVERARFLVTTIRTHLARRVCQLHTGGLSGVEELLGVVVRWCPACGAALS
jgi:hypothetical protein